MRRCVAWLSVLPFLALAFPGQAEQISLRGLTLAYDGRVWEAEPLLDDGIWRLDCVTEDCRGISPLASPFVYVVVRDMPPADAACVRPDPGAAPARPALFTHTREDHGGVAFDVTTTVGACSSADPWLLEACGADSRSEYLITTGFTFGTNCGPVPKLPVGRFRELLDGIAPAGPAP